MYSQITSNKRKTWLLLFAFVALIAALGFGLGWVNSKGNQQDSIGFMGIFGIVAMAYAAFSYFISGKLTLAMAHAKPVERKDHFELFTTVENLAITAGIPTPQIYLIDDPCPNAFATGRDPAHAVVAATTGLLAVMDKSELQAVMAHEISHIQNYDTRIQCLTVALVGLIAFIADVLFRVLIYGGRSSRRERGNGGAMVVGLLMALISLIFAKIMHFAISREREYLADASGVLLTRYPEGLAKALEKLEADHSVLMHVNKATAHLYIENPLENESGWKWLNDLFSTHPPLPDRIARLRGVEKEG